MSAMSVWHRNAPLPALVLALPRYACTPTCVRLLSSLATPAVPSSQDASHHASSGVQGVPLDRPTHLVWGANTGVGKTLVSVGLAHAAARHQVPFLYLKPVQTGFPADSDARLVSQASGAHVSMGPHATEQASRAATTRSRPSSRTPTPQAPSHAQEDSMSDAAEHSTPPSTSLPLQVCHVEHAWGAPVSPHVAVQQEGRAVEDGALRSSVVQHLQAFHAQLLRSRAVARQCRHQQNGAMQMQQQEQQHAGEAVQGSSGCVLSDEQVARLASRGMALVESAGGVASPGPSGRLLSDTLRPLRLPAILVGDPRLGGISSTISAYESLLLRGYDTDVILFMDQPPGPDSTIIASCRSGNTTTERTSDSISTTTTTTTSTTATKPRGSSAGDSSSSNNISSDNDSSSSSSCSGSAPLQVHADPCAAGGTNAEAVRAHLASQFHTLGRQGPRVMSLPACPPPPASSAPSSSGLDESLAEWLEATVPHFDALLAHLSDASNARMAYLHSMRARATSSLWWPFTQHATLQPGGIQVLDSRWGDTWQALGHSNSSGSINNSSSVNYGSHTGNSKTSSISSGWSVPESGNSSGSQSPVSPSSSAMVPLYDACSSWWTQAATAEHHAELSRAVAYATGRYLHVMFPENVHQAALEAAERLLQVVGGSWAKRVFFSDDGSTAVEVALKMAFRAYMQQHGLDVDTQQDGSGPVELQVVGLANAYHGDTLGAMDCVPPSPFNGPAQAPWYRGRGLFFEPPYVAMEKGTWQVVQPAPAWIAAQSSSMPTSWSSLDEVLSPARGGSSLAQHYRQHIEEQLDAHERTAQSTSSSSGNVHRKGRLAALVIEPLLQGAGGMLMVDPQFQRELVQACRARSMVVIFDEVMTGGFRLGAPTAASLLGLPPDIACFAKLVTGGVLPMAATLTTERVFKAFEGNSKMQALLHGHSYTAYPAGCAAVVAALTMLTSPAHNPNLAAAHGTLRQNTPMLQPMWDEQTVAALSHHPAVSRLVAIGSLLAMQVRTQQASAAGAPINSYASSAGAALCVATLLRDRHGIFARPLGDVLYLMVSPVTPRATCDWLLSSVRASLDEHHSSAHKGTKDTRDGYIV